VWRGSAHRIRHALNASADIAVSIDGDNQFNPNEINELINPILAGRAILV